MTVMGWREGKKLLRPLRSMLGYWELTPAARAVRRRDHDGLPGNDPGGIVATREAVGWLSRAQDRSASHDGGAARHFSLLTGWSSSYPETTGYIVPTLLQYAEQTSDQAIRSRARRMLDWLVSIQLPSGAYQGGVIGAGSVTPVTFNTGQIVFGLAAGVRDWGDPYRHAMRRAADWLVQTQDPDGCWRQFPTPFAEPGEKTYETHVAWGLLEAARVDPGRSYAEAALANVRWALQHQHPNGWLGHCCLTDPERPLTHTLGYALRGIVEAYRFSREPALLEAARDMADGLLGALGPEGHLPGRLLADWSPAVRWACLTGTAQIACCWFLLYEETGDPRYRRAGSDALRYVRRTMVLDGPDDIRGGVTGCFPVDGEYGTYQYLNWAAKFLIDANLLELQLLVPETVGAAAVPWRTA